MLTPPFRAIERGENKTVGTPRRPMYRAPCSPGGSDFTVTDLQEIVTPENFAVFDIQVVGIRPARHSPVWAGRA